MPDATLKYVAPLYILLILLSRCISAHLIRYNLYRFFSLLVFVLFYFHAHRLAVIFLR